MPNEILDNLRLCAVPDALGAETVCRWPNPRVTWCLTELLPGISYEDMRDAYALAWSRWAEACGLVPVYSTQARTANVLVGVGRIDGPMGVLAWSELPCGGPTQLTQRYDDGEPWVISDSPPANRIDLLRVACHEIGHVIGLPHIESGNLLQPTYSRAIRAPQSGDIREAVRRYGPAPTLEPKPKPTPAPAPEPKPTPFPPSGGKNMKWVDYVLAGLNVALQGAKWMTPKDPTDDNFIVALIALIERWRDGTPEERAALTDSVKIA